MTNIGETGRTPDATCVLFVRRSSTSEENQMNVDETIPTQPRSAMDDRWTETLDRIQAFVAARVDDRELAADITQDVIVRSIASGALERVDNPAAWLYRSARNAVIDHYRTRRNHASLDGLDAWPAEDVDDEPNEAMRELSRCLQPMLDQISPAGQRRARSRRRRRSDPVACCAPTRAVTVGHEVARSTRAPRPQRAARAVLRSRGRPSRRRHRLPTRRRRVRLQSSHTVRCT